MPEYNFFQVELSYEIIQNKTWMLDRMELNYYSKDGKTKKNGSTSIVFDDVRAVARQGLTGDHRRLASWPLLVKCDDLRPDQQHRGGDLETKQQRDGSGE